MCRTFEDTYRPPLIAEQISHVLQAVQPDVVHVHNLLNLSFDLPAVASGLGIPVVATLHDYGFVCPSGGQRLHRAALHVCHDIDVDRCARCFRESPFHAQISFGRIASWTHASGNVRRAAMRWIRRLPRLAGRLARVARGAPLLNVSAQDIDRRLRAAARMFDHIDRFVAPSPYIARQFQDLGVPPSRIRVSDYGVVPLLCRREIARENEPLRIGYVGTIAWHKGVHVLIDAVRLLPPHIYELKIFGDTAVFPDYAADLRHRAAGLAIRFMGPFPRERTADVYEQIDVLAIPSLWLENSPLVIHEALMAGVPIVGARIGGIPDLVADGHSGLLFDPDSPNELTSALHALATDRNRLESLANGARMSRIKSIAQDAGEWEATYADLLQRRHPTGAGA